MTKLTKATIEIQGTVVSVLSEKQNNYICLTDIAHRRVPFRTDYLIPKWLRTYNTVEFLRQ